MTALRYQRKNSVDPLFRDLEEALASNNEAVSHRLYSSLVEKNLKLVYHQVHRLRRLNLDHQIDQEELICIGSEGLCKAVKRFKYSRGNAFSSFAIPYIAGEIFRFIRDKAKTIRVPQKDQSQYKRFLAFSLKYPNLNNNQLIKAFCELNPTENEDEIRI